MFVKKYEPKTLSEVVGQDYPSKLLFNFYSNFKSSRKKAVILHGPPGSGKNSIIYALVNQENLELIEINASDKRNKDAVLEILTPASQQYSLFGGNKIILIDEVDIFSGTKDRGGIPALIDIIKKTNFPIIMTANDVWDSKLKTLRNYCEIISLNKLTEKDILVCLKNICEKEKIDYEEKALRKLALSVDGDLRAAINDLEVMSTKEKITLETLKLWGREKEESILNVLKLIFKSMSPDALNAAVFYVNAMPEDVMLWVEENVSKEYFGEDLKKAYSCLSLSDIFLARIRKWQHWRFLVHASYLSTIGVQQAKEEINPHSVSHSKPEFFLNLWKMAAKRKKYRGLAEQFSGKLHASTRQLQRDFAPYLSFIEQNNPEMHKKLMENV